MKKLLLLLLCVPLIGVGQNRYHIDEVTWPNDTIAYLKHDMSLLNGVVYCEFGELGNFIGGKRNDEHKRWYENGQLKFEGNFKDDKEDGLQRHWYENGQLKYEGNYKDGKKDGLWRVWYKNGQLKYERNYKDGKRID